MSMVHQGVFAAAILITSFGFVTVGRAQLVKNTSSANVIEDVKISVSVGLGYTGFERNFNIQKIDANGIEYDLFSRLRNPEIQRAVDLSPETRSEILSLHRALVQELEAQSLELVVGGADAVKARFEQVHQDAAELISDEQWGQIELAAAKVDIDKVGLANFLQSPANSLGLDLGPEDMARLNDARAQCKAQWQKDLMQLRRDYNQRWLDRLPAKQRESIAALKECEAFQKWLETELVSGREIEVVDKPRLTSDRSRTICYSKATRKRLEITAQQLQEIQDIRERHRGLAITERTLENNRAIRDVLNPNQYSTIQLEGWQRRAKSKGTIDEIINGGCVWDLELDERARQSLGDEAKSLAESYLAAREELQIGLQTQLGEAMAEIAPGQSTRLAEIISASVSGWSADRHD